MDKKTQYYILNALRRIFQWSSLVKEAKNRSGKGLPQYIFKCGICELLINHKNKYKGTFLDQNSIPIYTDTMHIDHINPVTPIEGWKNVTQFKKEIIGKIFVDSVDDILYICSCCHYLKTQIENSMRIKNV